MKCNTKTILFTGIGLFAALAAVYVALPQFRALELSAAPFLLFLLCPLSMMFMMKGMSSHGDQTQPASISTGKMIEHTDQSSTRAQ
jgi:Protein of unknown function (DUF2933)